MKPYSVSATNPIGTVEMITPAIGMNPHMKTQTDHSPIPGIHRAHIPRAVRTVFTNAIRLCAWSALPKRVAKTFTDGAIVLYTGATLEDLRDSTPLAILGRSHTIMKESTKDTPNCNASKLNN